MAESKPLPHQLPGWKGYTLDELRYQRALVAARVEIQKERLVVQSDKLRNAMSSPTGVWGRIFSSINYVDYAVLAFQLISRTTRTLRKLRGH